MHLRPEALFAFEDPALFSIIFFFLEKLDNNETGVKSTTTTQYITNF